jgi:hypothetical protein
MFVIENCHYYSSLEHLNLLFLKFLLQNLGGLYLILFLAVCGGTGFVC